jgi:hypothetical protein
MDSSEQCPMSDFAFVKPIGRGKISLASTERVEVWHRVTKLQTTLPDCVEHWIARSDIATSAPKTVMTRLGYDLAPAESWKLR